MKKGRNLNKKEAGNGTLFFDHLLKHRAIAGPILTIESESLNLLIVGGR